MRRIVDILSTRWKLLLSSFALALTLLFLCSHLQTEVPKDSPPIPTDWVQHKAGEVFSFYLPPDMQDLQAQGIDSLVGSFMGTSARVEFDYGRWSGIIEGDALSLLSHRTESIHGRECTIVLLDDMQLADPPGHHTQAESFNVTLIAQFPEPKGEDGGLGFYVQVAEDEDLPIGLAIVRSIQFH